MTPSPTTSIALAFRQGFGPRLTVEKAVQECAEMLARSEGRDRCGSSHALPQAYDILIRQPRDAG